MRNVRLVWFVAVAVASAALSLSGAVGASTATTGNGAPSGAHYDLNIIGVPKGKTASMTGSNTHVIFVSLGTTSTKATSKILLSQSTDGTFHVLDGNATLDGSATFSLPAPGSYTVWGRALGKPGGSSTVTTCAYDTSTGTSIQVCSINSAVFVRGSGKSSFTNVTADLTTIVTTALVGTCTSTTVSLFDPCLQGYFWNYDNNGLKLLQLRFYFTG
jgi:hypothetical protein